MAEYDDAIQALLDKKAIEEVLVKYCRGADRGDADLIAEAYHPAATEDHGGTFLGSAADYLEMIRKVLPSAGRMSHAITNMLIELEDSTHATSECYIMTFSRREAKGEAFDSLTMARLIDKFEKRGGKWAIVHRRLAWEWNHEMPTRETWGRGMIAPDVSKLIRGGKKPNDILYNFGFGRE
ncbi:nuclear transport factor 2 family protein [Kordiimonas pumila]|uniref:Nuclear transport factor 2 family protein n=1 Tax=Kordiimonas pumila TaxID=2161677 RepID=A0ABV7D5W4_9PROT|nr:nuclear transport factor 2 family protein [Kordiimonas pumila]